MAQGPSDCRPPWPRGPFIAVAQGPSSHCTVRPRSPLIAVSRGPGALWLPYPVAQGPFDCRPPWPRGHLIAVPPLVAVPHDPGALWFLCPVAEGPLTAATAPPPISVHPSLSVLSVLMPYNID